MSATEYLYDDNDLDCAIIQDIIDNHSQEGYQVRVQVVKFKESRV